MDEPIRIRSIGASTDNFGETMSLAVFCDKALSQGVRVPRPRTRQEFVRMMFTAVCALNDWMKEKGVPWD